MTEEQVIHYKEPHLRKGQKLCNWILSQGWDNERVHQYLFYMSDWEFNKVMSSSWEMLQMSNEIQKEIEERNDSMWKNR